MGSQWNRTLIKFLVWLTAEILLNSISIDDIADYSEFVFERSRLLSQKRIVASLVINFT